MLGASLSHYLCLFFFLGSPIWRKTRLYFRYRNAHATGSYVRAYVRTLACGDISRSDTDTNKMHGHMRMPTLLHTCTTSVCIEVSQTAKVSGSHTGCCV